jgi:hypothetical protein
VADGVASLVVAGGVAAEAFGGVCVGAISAGRLVTLVCRKAELAVTAGTKAVSDHMLEFERRTAARTYFERRVHRLEGLLSSF